MSISEHSSDARRNAERYNRLMLALRHATHELRSMEASSHLDVDDILTKLLPDITAALHVERAFVAKHLESKPMGSKEADSKGITRSWIQLISIYPEQDLANQLLEATELLQSLLQDGNPRVIDPLDSDDKQLILGLELLQATSAMLMRLQTVDQTYIVGVCNKRDPEEGPFLATDRITLNHILELIAVGARTAERHKRELESIQHISETVAQGGDLTEVAHTIVEQVVTLTKCAYAALWAVNKYRAQLEFVSAKHATVQRWQPQQPHLPLDNSSMNGYVARHGVPDYAPQIEQAGHYVAWDAQTRSAFCAPLVWNRQILGTLYVASYVEDGISPEDQRFIEQLALHAAIALHNARVQEMRQRVIQFQQNISDVLPLPKQMHEIREQLGLQVDTRGLFIALYDAGEDQVSFPMIYVQGVLIDEAAKTLEAPYAPRLLAARQGLAEWVLLNRSTLLVDDFDAWPRHAEIDPAERTGVKCCLVAPLFSKGNTVGAIGLCGYERAGSFDEYDRRFLEGLANHVAIIIDNSLRYDATVAQLRESNAQLEQRVRELQALSEFQEQISDVDDSEYHEIQNVYTEAHAALYTVGIDTENMYIALYHQDSNTVEFPLVFERGKQLSREEKQARDAYRARKLGERPDLTEWILHNGEMLLAQRRDELDALLTKNADIQFIPEFSKSWLGAPMIAANKLIGMVALRNFDQEGIFDEHHRNLLNVIASQSAIAIQNARLYRSAHEQIRRLQALHEAGRTITAAGLTRDTILQAILEQAVSVTDSFFGTLQLINGEMLEFVAAWPPEKREELRHLYGQMSIHGRGITARAARLNDAQLVADVSKDPDYVDATGKTGSALAVILRRSGASKGAPMGVLNVERQVVNGLNREDRRMLIALSNLAVAAIQNAEQAEQLSRTNAVAVMGAWGAEMVHDIHREVAAIKLALDSIRLQEAHSWQEMLKRLQEIDAYVDSLVMPPLPEATPAPGNGAAAKVATPVDRVIQSEIEKLARSHSTVHFHLQMACPEAQVKIHEQWLRRLLRHLVKNAIYANWTTTGAIEVTIGTNQSDGYTEIWVQDNGRGVRPEIVPLLFKQPIPHAGQRKTERAGRGLLLVHHIVELHGGKVWLKSNQTNVGACFALAIPVAVIG